MLNDHANLLDIVEAGNLINEFISNISTDTFFDDKKTQSAVLHQLLIIGEATKRLSKEFRNQHPDIPWRLIAGMRDVLIHAYESVDLDEVWNTAIKEIPDLVININQLLSNK